MLATAVGTLRVCSVLVALFVVVSSSTSETCDWDPYEGGGLLSSSAGDAVCFGDGDALFFQFFCYFFGVCVRVDPLYYQLFGLLVAGVAFLAGPYVILWNLWSLCCV